MKQKTKLIETLIWLLNNLNIIEKTDFLETSSTKPCFEIWCKYDLLHNFKAPELKLRPNDIRMTWNSICNILIPKKL